VSGVVYRVIATVLSLIVGTPLVACVGLSEVKKKRPAEKRLTRSG